VIQNYVIILGLVVTFAIIMAIGQGFYWTYVSRKEYERDQLARRLGTMTEAEAEALLFRERARDYTASALGNLGTHLQNTLMQAESEATVGDLIIRMCATFFISGLLIYFVIGSAGILVAIALALLPYLYYRHAAGRRTKQLLSQLPEALDLMARSLQAGLGLSDAFKLAAEEMPLPIAGEFGRVFEEIRFGRDYRTALTSMTNKNPGIFELRMFVSSVLLQRETGGNLIEILNTISTTIRHRFVFDAKVRALTAEARFSAIILGGLPLAVGGLILWSNPQYISPMFDDALGQIMLLIFVCLYAVGGFLMYTISQVEV